MKAKDKLTEPECDEGCTASSNGGLRERTNPMWQLRVATHPFPQRGLHALFFQRKLQGARVNITKNGQKQLVCHIFQSHGDLTAGKKESVDGGTPPADQMEEIEQISVVR